MTSPITFTGLGSGIDLASILDAQLEAERLRHVAPFERWRSEWEDKISAFQSLNAKLSSLHTTAKALDTESEFFVKGATSTDTDVLSATADSSAVNDSYTLEVNQLAQTEKLTHDGMSSEDAVVNASGASAQFVYTYNGTTRSITVTDGTTLSTLVRQINNDVQNPGVTASVLNDGSGGSSAWHLVLSGQEPGSGYGITIEAATTLAGFSAADFAETQTAQNAQVRVNGYPASGWIERDSNTFADVIPGVNIALAGAGSATVTITSDTEAVREKIYEFVSAFNEVRNYIREQTAYDTNTETGGILLGNYAVDIIKNRLNALVSTTPSGFRSDTDTYANLMQIGISTDVDQGSETQGQLVIDESELNAALSENPDAVAELFSTYYSGRSASSGLEFTSYIEGITDPGTYEVEFNSADPAASRIRYAGGTWHTATWDAAAQTLTGVQGTPESGLVVHVLDTGSSFTGEVDLRQGLAGDLKEELDRLVHSTDGPLAVLEENYQDIIDGINDKIDYEENRIDLLEQRLRERYARLEELLTEMNSQSSYLENYIAQLQ